MFIPDENITPLNLYKIVGRDNYFLTVYLNDNSELNKIYPSSIHGNLFYTQDERTLYETDIDVLNETSIIKISSSMSELSAEQTKRLKYNGINCSEIASVLFIPFSHQTQADETGLKKVPNVIEIPYSSESEFEYEGLTLHLYSRLLLKDELLLNEELYEFIGIMLAMNDSRIPGRYQEKIKLTKSEIENHPKIAYYYLVTKSKKEKLTSEETQKLNELKIHFFREKLDILYSELKKASSKLNKLSKYTDQFEKIMKEITNFKTDRFGFRKPVIYWNLESYLHIILRHLKETQVGENFIYKSMIPYKFDDLKILIDKILSILDKEIKDHFNTNPEQKFTRHGKMSVSFNDDYYSIDIAPDGRISSFYNKTRKS